MYQIFLRNVLLSILDQFLFKRDLGVHSQSPRQAEENGRFHKSVFILTGGFFSPNCLAAGFLRLKNTKLPHFYNKTVSRNFFGLHPHVTDFSRSVETLFSRNFSASHHHQRRDCTQQIGTKFSRISLASSSKIVA